MSYYRFLGEIEAIWFFGVSKSGRFQKFDCCLYSLERIGRNWYDFRKSRNYGDLKLPRFRIYDIFTQSEIILVSK